MNTDRVPATRADFEPVSDPAQAIGKAVHVEGLWRGCRWTLVSFEQGRAELVAKVSGKRLRVNCDRLLWTRRNEAKKASKR